MGGGTLLTFARSEVWSPDRKQTWLKDKLQSLPGVRWASYAPGCSLALSTDAVTELDLCPSWPLCCLPWSFSLSSTAHEEHTILFRVAEPQPRPQTEDMWLHLPHLPWEGTSPVYRPQCYLHPAGTNTSIVGMNGVRAGVGWGAGSSQRSLSGGRAQRILIQRQKPGH